MVEAGILAAIAIVMALIVMYVPVLGAFVNFLWPLPIVICGARHGLKWSIMTLLVATIIIAIELIHVLNSQNLESVIEILMLAFTRELVIREWQMWQLLIGVGCIAGLFAIKKWLFNKEE